MANAEQALPRAYDLIVYGASGFTGRLVAEHLLGTRVEVRIGPFGIGRDDGVGCQRGERTEPLFALGYRPLAYYTIRDVGDDG